MSQEARSGAAWIPRTKLVVPRPAPHVEPDPAVLDTLRRATTTASLTLITAQAGSGKTTAAAAFAAATAPRTAWISLDDGDDDLVVLLHLIAMALNPLLPDGCAALDDLLRAGLPGAGDGRRAAGVLVNDVLADDPDPILLVLDDLHVLTDAEALAALGYLLDHLPPTLRVLATARHDPPLHLARRRVHGTLAEVRSEQLRCTVGRADALLNGRLELGLSPEQVAHTVSASGGWITGVRLLGELLARGRGTAAGVTDSADLYDYLAEEVLAIEPERVRRFLLDTCVLDELTPASCDALTMAEDATALLAGLHRTHPFLVTTGLRGGGYRYQALFATFLRGRLDLEPARAAKLHRRAADIVDEPARRIEHLLAAGAHDAAAAEIEQLCRSAPHHSMAARRIAGWADRLDRPYRDRPWVAAVAGLAAVSRGDMTRATTLLEAAHERFEAAGDVPGQWMAARNLHLATNDHARFAPILARLEGRPEFAQLPPAAQVDHHVGGCYGALHTGNWTEAARRLAVAIEITTTTRDLGAVEVLAQHLGPVPATCDGALEKIESYAAWVRRQIPDPPPLIRLGADQQGAITAFLRGRLDEAVAAADAAGDLPERLGGLPFTRAALVWVQAGAAFARGDSAGALAVLDVAGSAPASELDHALRTAHLALRARILRQRHDGTGLGALVREVDALAPGWRYAERLELVATSVRAQAAWEARDLVGAERILRGGLALEDRLRMVAGVGNLQLDLALVLADAGRSTQARRALGPLLAMVARRGWLGVLVEAGPEVVPLLESAARRGVGTGTARAALDVLAGAARVRATPVPGTAEVLSVREMEVLRLLAGGASNADLATRLGVSVNTVRTHVSHLMTKLSARSRTEAVARGRALHLL
ncbi:MAG: LuxR C-terminal-related transcriptional regulator [Pseudonocardia sp.]